MKPLVLAVDFGTQSVRAVAFDRAGNTAARAAVPVAPPQVREPGWAEHDAHYLTDRVSAACAELWRACDCRDAIGALALTTIRSSVVPVDAEGAALYPVILWPDRRRLENAPGIGGVTGALLHLTGARDAIARLQREAECNWLAAHEPRLWGRCAKFLLLSGYLHHWLTGRYCDASAAQVGYLPFDFRRLRWARAGSWQWRALPGLRREQLPELADPGQRIGTITARAAAATGLRAGTPVIAAAADKACEVFGAGADRAAVACLSLGTAATVNVPSTRFVGPGPLVPPFPAARPGCWNLEVQLSEGFARVRWFAATYAEPERAAAARSATPVERLLDRLLDESPPGANGLIARPSWSPVAVRSRDIGGAACSGSFIANTIDETEVFLGLGERHTRADRYRALLESLAFGLRDGLATLTARTGRSIRHLYAAGGGACSDPVLRLLAAVFARPIERAGCADAAALGAAINAAVGLEWFRDHGAAAAQMRRPGEICEPDPREIETYARLSRERHGGHDTRGA